MPVLFLGRCPRLLGERGSPALLPLLPFQGEKTQNVLQADSKQ